MRSHRSHLGVLVGALLLGVTGAHVILVPQEPVRAKVGESVLLPVTYVLPHPPVNLRVIWSFEMSMVVFSELSPCRGNMTPSMKLCQDYSFVVEKYRHRAMFFPENASLLLRVLRPEDSGLYTIAFQELNETRTIMLSVQDPEGPPNSTESVQTIQPEREASAWRHLPPPGTLRFTCAAIFLLVILVLHCVWWRQVRHRQPPAHRTCQPPPCRWDVPHFQQRKFLSDMKDVSST
ncbi:HEPACAM family member 2-like [Aquarana catesbeiana]|uniref:HEPACAM family member 2-like n=1 Tax=Aquarana catesbeiana TaxID=8400 RepID=UPI003CCA32BE